VVIVGSLLLILVAVALLVGGVVAGSNVLVVACIVVTTVAAITLVVGVRQSANAEADETDDDDEETTDVTQMRERGARESHGRDRVGDGSPRWAARQARGESVYGAGRAERASALVDEPVSRGSIPSQGSTSDRFVDGSETERFAADAARGETTAQSVAVADIDDEPEDEPSIQIVSPSMASRVAMLTTDVLVIDGRPRYHVAGCVHLIGRESEPLPVGEAVELGFTPCGMCEPDSALLAQARRV
jgi:hypothetical protein